MEEAIRSFIELLGGPLDPKRFEWWLQEVSPLLLPLYPTWVLVIENADDALDLLSLVFQEPDWVIKAPVDPEDTFIPSVHEVVCADTIQNYFKRPEVQAILEPFIK